MKTNLVLFWSLAGVFLLAATAVQSQSPTGTWVRQPNTRDSSSIELTFKPSQQAEYLFDGFERASVPYQLRGEGKVFC